METRVFTGLVFAFLIGIVTAGGGLAINSALSSSSCPTSNLEVFMTLEFFVMIIDSDGSVLKM